VTLFEIDPLTDSRWPGFLQQQAQASAFHSTGWLRALATTYGYSPVAFTTTPHGSPLADAIVFCEIQSWLTGHRFVSLPFADHCAPLVNSESELFALLSTLRIHPRVVGSRFFELRGGAKFTDFRPDFCSVSATYVHHKLSLEPRIDEIFEGFHPSCIRRAIRRAEREGLRVECGGSDSLVSEFFRLQLQTRRRHGLPPQPLEWFKNLASTMGENLQVRVAFQGDHAVAAILTLTDSHTMIYKYGASESRSHSLGGVPLLMWIAIQEAKAANLSEFDFGRSDLSDSSLIQFKERFGALRTPLSYHRLFLQEHLTAPVRVRAQNSPARGFFRRLPSPILAAFGRMLYRHMG